MWGQVAKELVDARGIKVSRACRLFGRCRQSYYQSQVDIQKDIERERTIIDSVKVIREQDPGIGCYKLWLMLISIYGRQFMFGRDCFYTLLRRHHLMLPPPKPRHTTNSNHRYHKWKNLIKDFTPIKAGQLWVSDITYINLAGGDVAYLHLITDAYSHKIIGWKLADTLRASVTRDVLEQAIEQALPMSANGNLIGLIHHSDRGVQYCCDEYVNKLKQFGIAISMTEDYTPTDNAIAERVNGIIKTECVYRYDSFNDIEHARLVIGRFIHFYNYFRPHMSINYKIPAVAHMENGHQQKAYIVKNKIGSDDCRENIITLQGQATSLGESVSQ